MITAVTRGARPLLGGLVVTAFSGRDNGRRYAFRRVPLVLERLGPTFVKFAQVAGVRRDLLPAELCAELAVLHDAVPPMSPRDVCRGLDEAYPDQLHQVFRELHLTPVASGSIACVLRGQLLDGRDVVVKLRRPRIEPQMTADLALLESAASTLQRLPKGRGMPLRELTAYVSRAILGQLDFDHERENIVRLAKALVAVPGIRTPVVVPEACRPGCLVMEFLPDLRRDRVVDLPAPARRQAALNLLLAVQQLVFVEGLIHCDLHPGNVYVSADGTVTVLDAGFTVQIPPKVRDLLGDFFQSLVKGDGRRCGEIIVESAEVTSGRDISQFVEQVAELVARTARAGQFTMFPFGNEIFDLQREFGLYAESDFAFPLMSLAVLEGTARQIDPELNLLVVAPPGST